jgi:hypothetical protein
MCLEVPLSMSQVSSPGVIDPERVEIKTCSLVCSLNIFVGGSSSSAAWAWCLFCFLLYSSCLAGQNSQCVPSCHNGSIVQMSNLFPFVVLSSEISLDEILYD